MAPVVAATARPASPLARPRRTATLGVVLAVTAGLLLGCAAGPDRAVTPGPVAATPARSGPDPAAGPSVTASPPVGSPSSDAAAPVVPGEGVAPAQVRVPVIGIDEKLIDLGLQADGTMEVPADWDRVGWFTGGGRPGGAGPTVIAGHVDSLTGPAVFYRLTELVVGDLIEVTDVEGRILTYAVYRVEDVPKDDFPTAEVFGARPTDELRLITCTGVFDPASARHADNRVVFAELTTAPPRPR